MSKCTGINAKKKYRTRYGEEVELLCPYIQAVLPCKVVCNFAVCNSITADFKTNAKRNEYIYNFCSCGCWRGCRIAAINGEIYRTKNHNI